GGRLCWDNSGSVMTNICGGDRSWVMPLKLDSGGRKNVSVTGKLIGGVATCSINSFTPTGAQESGFPVTFPEFSSSMSSATVSPTFVAGDISSVSCTTSGKHTVELLKLDYAR